MARSMDALRAQGQEKYGADRVIMANEVEALDVIPTGIMALDYALGVGGWPRRHAVGVFGSPGVGKSSILGLSAIKSTQKLGLNAAIVSVERRFDPKWATKLGVKVEDLLIYRPNNAEQAFEQLQMIVESGVVDFVLFDSIGALRDEAEMDTGVNRVGGASKTITSGMLRVAPAIYDNNVCAMFINQVRDVIGSRIPLVKQPGGWGLEHVESVVVELRYHSGTGSKFQMKDPMVPEKKLLVGRKMVAKMVKNQVAEGTDNRAVFNFFQKETGEYPFGIDTGDDVINTAVRLGVIKRGGAYYTAPDGHRTNGGDPMVEYLLDNEKAFEEVRDGVLTIMRSKAHKPDKGVNGNARANNGSELEAGSDVD